MERLIERFLRYVKIDTQSNPKSDTCPSTDKQKNQAMMRLWMNTVIRIR